MVAAYALGAVVRLRKPHPCGGGDWEITRLGADIGLRCLSCRRRVLMPRATLDKRLKAVLSADPRGLAAESASTAQHSH